MATPTDPNKPIPPGPGASFAPPPPGTDPNRPREIKLVSHSPIFYWWPIWVLGYVMALITYFENNHLAILPPDSKVAAIKRASDGKPAGYTIEANGSTRVLERAAGLKPGEAVPEGGVPVSSDAGFKTRVSHKAWMGPVYCVVLLLTIIITNVPLRGLWSFLVLLMLVVLALVFTVFDVWESLLGAIGNLHIYINMAGYLFIATAVFVLWAVSVFIFDQRTYMIVTPGQIRVCEHIGASIRNFDTTGLSFEKQRDDLFRHWILGFFSGDLIVRTAGAEREEIRLPNVLWIGWRLEEVQEILREKAIVAA